MSEKECETGDVGFVLIANQILQKCKINGEIHSLEECSDTFFIAVYEGILGEKLKGVVSNAVSRQQRISNCDKVIVALSHDVLNVDLSHIIGKNIIDGDRTTIANLLEIFKELLDFILDGEEDFYTEKDDSNILSSDHEIISDVLQEEFGQDVFKELPVITRDRESLSSDHSTIGEPELSTIPKCSDVCSSSSSDVDTNTTDEIIRKSDLLQRHLSRDYPSLRCIPDERVAETSGAMIVSTESNVENIHSSKHAEKPAKYEKHFIKGDENRNLTAGWQSSTESIIIPTGSEKEYQRGDIGGFSQMSGNVKGLRADVNHDKKDEDENGERSSLVVTHDDNCEKNKLSSRSIIEGTGSETLTFNSCNNRRIADSVTKKKTIPGEKHLSPLKTRSTKTKTGRGHQDCSVRNVQDKEKLVTTSGGTHGDDIGTIGDTASEHYVNKGERRTVVVERKATKETKTLEKHRENRQLSNDSESSGVFWEDQISPLDVNERLRNSSQGHAFDEIGLANKSRDFKTRQWAPLSNGSRDSTVMRHYHHHFHHGNSGHVPRDVDFNKRTGRLEREIKDLRLTSERAGSQRDAMIGVLKDNDRVKNSREKRSVKFDDRVDTRVITSRLGRLERDMEIEKRQQYFRQSKIKDGYNMHLERLNREHRRIEEALKKPAGKNAKRSSPYGKSRVTRDRMVTNQRKARYPSTKARRRSSSCSPGKSVHRNKKVAKQLENRDVILPTLLDEFPFLHLSPHTLQTMRQKQTQQLLSLSKSSRTANKRHTKTQKVLEDAEKRQQTLLKILRKDLQHNERMREQKHRLEQERSIKSKLREKRQASARARRYYEDYQLRMRARMLKRRTKEEQIFKNLYEDGLEIQKRRVRELRSYAKEQREIRAAKEQNELTSLENFYRDQYSILAEAIDEEKEALLVRERAQEKVIQQMQRNLREKLQKEVTEIQETLVRDEDDAYFRRLDAERLRRQLQMTAFQNLS